jgi:hypothetical protein
MIREHDRIVLTQDIPHEGLPAGDVGCPGESAEKVKQCPRLALGIVTVAATTGDSKALRCRRLARRSFTLIARNERYRSHLRNDPPGKPVAFRFRYGRGVSGERNRAPGKPVAFRELGRVFQQSLEGAGDWGHESGLARAPAAARQRRSTLGPHPRVPAPCSLATEPRRDARSAAWARSGDLRPARETFAERVGSGQWPVVSGQEEGPGAKAAAVGRLG